MTGISVGYPVDAEIDQSQLVKQHTALLKRIAYHLASRLPASVQVDDLTQAGVVGLLEAARHYDPTQGASFETYAGIRIRGAMLDELRKTDWTPRSVHRKTRQLVEVVQEIEHREGRPARDAEVAQEMQIDLEDYYRLLRDVVCTRILSVEEMLGHNEDQSNADPDPLEELQRDAFKQALAETIESLPQRERYVLALYYDEELNLREIGEVLGVSESRVCQIHGQALIRLRARMKDWIYNEP